MSSLTKRPKKIDQPKDELAEEVPVWASVTILGTVLFSWMFVAYSAPSLPKDSNGVPMFVAAASPFFFITMFVEFLVIKAIRYRSVAAQFHLVDAWASISGGSTQQLISKALIKPLVVALGAGPLAYVWTNYRLVDVEHTPLVFCGSFVLLDLCYYWLHRCAHTIAFMWAAHSVHHNSEHYNLSTALRQSWLQHYFGVVFYVPAALFVPPSVAIACHQWNLLYQYWVHTCVVRRLGPLEWFLMTPSHHRVHHDRRVHKNFAGVFLWDRMFGTLVDEADAWEHPADPSIKANGGWVEEYETFGIMQEIESWQEPVLQYHGWKQIIQKMKAAKTLSGKVAAWIKGPGWSTVLAQRKLQRQRPTDPDDESRTARVMRRIRRHTTLPVLGNCYVIAQFLYFVVVYLLITTSKQSAMTMCLAGFVIWPNLMTQAMIWDAHRHALLAEFVKCVVVAGLTWACGPSSTWLPHLVLVSRLYTGFQLFCATLLLVPAVRSQLKATEYETVHEGLPAKKVR